MPSAAPEEVVPVERVWEEVKGRHRERLKKEMKSSLPYRKEAGLSLAFKRRIFGLYFRCLAADHFLANCRGSIRCLGYGHREQDCKAHHPPGQAPHLHPRGPPRTPGRPSRTPDCQPPSPLQQRLASGPSISSFLGSGCCPTRGLGDYSWRICS
jgi:hypothetical protein